MKRNDAHLVANLGLGLLAWIGLLWGAWSVPGLHLALRLLASALGLWFCGYLADRALPRLTGPVIDRLYGPEPSQPETEERRARARRDRRPGGRGSGRKS